MRLRQREMRQRLTKRWTKTDGEKEIGREIEGGQMEFRSQTFDSSWEEYLWGALFLIGVCVCVFGYVPVLTVLSCSMVNHSIAKVNSVFVYITLRGCVPLRHSILSCAIVFCVFMLVHHYTQDLSVTCLETPVCNDWKSALPASLARNC